MKIIGFIKLGIIIVCLIMIFPIAASAVSSFINGWKVAQKVENKYQVKYTEEEKIKIARRNWSKTCPGLINRIENASEDDLKRVSFLKMKESAQWCYDDRIRPKQ